IGFQPSVTPIAFVSSSTAGWWSSARTTSSWRSAGGIERCSTSRRNASSRKAKKGWSMTSSPEAAALDPGVAAIEPPPPAPSSMGRLCKLGYRHEPRLMLVSFVLALVAALPDALLALWLMLLGKGVLDRSAVLIATSAIGLALSATATWFLRTVSTRVHRRFPDIVTLAL